MWWVVGSRCPYLGTGRVWCFLFSLSRLVPFHCSLICWWLLSIVFHTINLWESNWASQLCREQRMWILVSEYIPGWEGLEKWACMCEDRLQAAKPRGEEDRLPPSPFISFLSFLETSWPPTSYIFKNDLDFTSPWFCLPSAGIAEHHVGLYSTGNQTQDSFMHARQAL